MNNALCPLCSNPWCSATALTIFERLRDEHGFSSKYTIVKGLRPGPPPPVPGDVRPLAHAARHAQCDFGEGPGWSSAEWSGPPKLFVKAYPAETTEAFLDGHVSAFAFLGGVPRSILYDNTKLVVARILGDGRRKRTRAFTELQSHYLFSDRFGRPGKGNDKGKVEGMVGYMRHNFLVPVPSFEEL